MEPEVNQ
jgi:hypothetical protein